MTVEFEMANVLKLPYPVDTFDVVIAESVLTFVKKKRGGAEGNDSGNRASWLCWN